MTLTVVEAVTFGISGGIIPEIVALYNLRKEENLPKWIKSPIYWSTTIIMILLGGFVAYMYLKQGTNLNEVMALHLGVTTPVLLGAFIKEKPPITD